MKTFLHTIRRAVGVLVAAAALQPSAYAANAPRPPQPVAAASAMQSRTIDANGVELHYLQVGHGDATPVVLLHGYTETSRMWQPLMTRLGGERVVIAPDLPGAGGSAMPASGYDKKTLAQDIHAMVQALGYRKVKLVGHDIGLMVAYAYAAQYPDEVESIVLMDAFLPGVGDWQKVWLLRDKWHFNFYGDTPEKLVRGRERVFFEHFWNDFAADPAHSVSEADRRYYSAQYARNGRMRAGFEYFHAFPQDADDFAAFAKTPLPMPMLVLTGERASGTFLIDQAKLVATNVQGVVVPGAGHWLMEEAPDATMAQLVRFIEQD
ncbi:MULTISPECIES: alpha/beta hydrolase [Caballeronia]|uniref:Alpha/beta hydrolase n=1 Tax=Caballeronia zhejiangensis TaxID=871203 RepID=A0A656QPR7_9BURK|nr:MULTISPECIES: alpha/beta hydrolase [Caballeronia]EKS67002.1 alpha/beta hydrolase [Burkholderia sp. SJ98]KDR30449.1 alpha/beta hydrolase [Caballeronia zhejiangensis]MDR5789721.1 alpha/beta hydrolase [Caballeronia sp. LP003]